MIKSFDNGSLETPFIVFFLIEGQLIVRCRREKQDVSNLLVAHWPKPNDVLLIYNRDQENYEYIIPKFDIFPVDMSIESSV